MKHAFLHDLHEGSRCSDSFCLSLPDKNLRISWSLHYQEDRSYQPYQQVKDLDEWTTGDEEMTGAQRSYLKSLLDETGEEVRDDLLKAEASKKIDELQQKTGRGKDH